MELFIAGLIVGGMITWLVAHLYYLKSRSDSNKIVNKIDSISRMLILKDPRPILKIQDIIKLFRNHIIDEKLNSKGEKLPFKRCPECGASDIRRKYETDCDVHGISGEYISFKCSKCGYEDILAKY